MEDNGTKSSLEVLDRNKVKLTVEVDEEEVEKAVEQAFKRIAKDARIPGFRRGKVPRRILEAQLGYQYGRSEALSENLPRYYLRALGQLELDTIDVPSFEIRQGQENGALVFDATVELRPEITVSGYHHWSFEVPNPLPTQEDVDAEIDRLRAGYVQYQTVERAAQDGDQLTINIVGSHRGEAIAALSANDYDYHLGSGVVVPELDENLRGTKATDEIEFEAVHPQGEDEPLHFAISVLAVKEGVLPEIDQDWVRSVSEFETVAELRADVEKYLSYVKQTEAGRSADEQVRSAVAALVQQDIPQVLIDQEVESRIKRWEQTIEEQEITKEQFLANIGQELDEFVAQLTEPATEAVKLDLALRAIACAEGLNGDQHQLAAITELAQRSNVDVDKYQQILRDGGELASIQGVLSKARAIDWLVEHTRLVDGAGETIEWQDINSTMNKEAASNLTEQSGETR